jgi:hypothetical protein
MRRTPTADTNLDDWRSAEHGRYQVDRSYGESWSITHGQVYKGEPADTDEGADEQDRVVTPPATSRRG